MNHISYWYWPHIEENYNWTDTIYAHSRAQFFPVTICWHHFAVKLLNCTLSEVKSVQKCAYTTFKVVFWYSRFFLSDKKVVSSSLSILNICTKSNKPQFLFQYFGNIWMKFMQICFISLDFQSTILINPSQLLNVTGNDRDMSPISTMDLRFFP